MHAGDSRAEVKQSNVLDTLYKLSLHLKGESTFTSTSKIHCIALFTFPTDVPCLPTARLLTALPLFLLRPPSSRTGVGVLQQIRPPPPPQTHARWGGVVVGRGGVKDWGEGKGILASAPNPLFRARLGGAGGLLPQRVPQRVPANQTGSRPNHRLTNLHIC